MTANTSDTNADQLTTWTCLKCGAPLPEEIGPAASVTCTYCGTPFKLPTATPRNSGVNISTTADGAITIDGNVIGGDLVLSPDGTLQPGTASGSGGVTLSSADIEIRGNIVGGNVCMPAPVTPPWAENNQSAMAEATQAPDPQALPSTDRGALSRFLNRFRKT